MNINMKNDDLIPYYYGCIVIMIFAISMIGCSQLKPVIETDYAIASGEVAETLQSVKLTDNEKLIITHAINSYQAFIDKWRVQSNVFDTQEFLADYESIKRQYLQVYNIVNPKWKLYDSAKQDQIKQYEQAAIIFDDQTKKLATAKAWWDAGQYAVGFASVLIGMAKAI